MAARKEQALQATDTESLQKLAAFQRLAWRSVHVRNADGSADDDPIVVDVVASATLADVRVVLRLVVDAKTLWKKSRPMGFSFVRSPDECKPVPLSDEAREPLTAFLHHGFVLYVLYARVLKPPPRSPRRALKPTLTASHQIGLYIADVDVYIDRVGVQIVLREIVETSSGRPMAALHGLNGAVRLELNVADMADVCESSADMISVLLTDGRQQLPIVQKIIERVVLALDDEGQLHLGIGPMPALGSQAPIALRKPKSPRRKPPDEKSSVEMPPPTATPSEDESEVRDTISTSELPDVAALVPSKHTSIREVPRHSAKRASLAAVTPSALPRHASSRSAAGSTRALSVDGTPLGGSLRGELVDDHDDDEGILPVPHATDDDRNYETPLDMERSSVSVAPIALELDRALVAALAFFTANDATPVLACMARDDLLLSYGMAEGSLLSKAGRSVLELREAFQRVMLLYLVAAPQSTTATTAVKRYLWRGLGFCLWREVRDDVVSSCRFQTMKTFSVIRSHYKQRETYPGFKDKLPHYPAAVVGALECLRLVLHPSDVLWLDATSVVDPWTHVVALGLHTMAMFRKTLDKIEAHCRSRTLPARHRYEIGVRVAAWKLPEATDEALFGTLHLRKLILLLLEASDGSWHPSIKIDHCFARAVTGRESTGVALHIMELRDVVSQRLEPLVRENVVVEEGRCAEVDAHCAVMVTDAWPPVARWYMPRRPLQPNDAHSRYFFVAERDAAFEMSLSVQLTAPLPVVYSVSGDAMLSSKSLVELLTLALPLWSTAADDGLDLTAMGGVLASCVGYGVNMLHAGVPSRLQQWSLLDVFKLMRVDRIGIGSGVAPDGRVAMVLLRVFGALGKPPLTAPADVAFISHLATTTDLASVLHHGGLPMCKLLATKEATTTVLHVPATSGSVDVTPTGPANDALERCLLAWQDADVGPSSFPLVMHYMHTQAISGHATVKVLKALNRLLDAQDTYVAAVITRANDIIGADGRQHDGDMLQRLVDLAATPGLPVRITELAQKAVLGALLHHELGSPTKLLQYFGTLPDHLLGLPSSRLPFEIAVASDHVLQKGPLLEHLSAAILLCLTDATATRETLECRFLCLLVTPGGIEFVLQSAVATMSLVARCMHVAKSALVVLHGARVIEVFVAALALRGESALPDSHDQANVLQIIVECILCRAQVAADVLQDAGRVIVAALATLLQVAPWHRSVLAALAPLLHDLAAPQRIFWLDRVTGIATSGAQSPDAVRFSAILLAQHQSTARCRCAALESSTRRIVIDMAARFVAHVLATVDAGFSTTAAPSRMANASISPDGPRKSLAANRIQTCALRWLYRHRKAHGFLPALLRYAACPVCETSPSLLAALVLLVCNTRSLSLRTTPLDASPKLRLQALQCLTKLWFYPSLAAAAVTDLHVDYVYLVLTSHDDMAWRSQALYSLSYLVLHAPFVLHSLQRTITQPLWPTLHATGPWLDVLLHTSLFAQRKSMLASATIVTYVDCALHLLVVLSYEHLLAPTLTRTMGFTLRLLQMLNDAPAKGTGDADMQLRRLRDRILPMALFVTTNVLLRLGASEAFAFEIPCGEVAVLLSASTPSLAQVQVLHMLWALALRKQGRDSLRWSSALLVALVAALSPRSGLASFESWAVVHGAAGVVACLAVDKDVCNDLCKLGLLDQLRDRLLDASVATWTASCDADVTKQAMAFYNAIDAAAGPATATVQRNAKLAALGILPLVGPGVPHAPSTLLRHQVLRSYTVCLVHKHRSEFKPWFDAFPASDAPLLLRQSMCASLSLLARVDATLSSAVPSELIERLVKLAGNADDETLQRLSMQALGRLARHTASVKQHIHSIDVTFLLATARPALQLEAIGMLALAAKNSAAPLPPGLHQGKLAKGLIRWLEQRDAAHIWHRKAAAWSSVLLDSDDVVATESRITKCLRRPLELLLLCQIDACDLPNIPSLLLNLLLETVTVLPHLLHDACVRDATALAVTLSLALTAGFEAASPWQPYCLTSPIVHGLIRTLTQSSVVASPTLTSNVLSALQVAIAADAQLRLEVLSDLNVVQALVSMVATAEAMQEPALHKALELLESVLQRDGDPNAMLAPFLSHPSGSYTALTAVFAVCQEASFALHAAALSVLGRLLEAPAFARYFLNGVFQTAGSRYKSYLERVLRSLALRDEWATGYRTRGVLLQQCAGAARLLASIASSASEHDEVLVALLLAKEGSYATTDAALDVLVQLFLDIGENRFLGAPTSTDLFSQLRVDITRTLASLGRNEAVRHASALQRFVSAVTATPVDCEPNPAVRANIVHIYQRLLCVPSVFRQLVFGQCVFLPPDDVANDAKPVFFFLGQQLAMDKSMKYRAVYASMAAMLLTDAAVTLEMHFLEQHTVASDCLTDALDGLDDRPPLVCDQKELTHRLQCLEQGMPFGVDAPLSRHVGVRLVHEVFLTVLHLWTTCETTMMTDGKCISTFLVQLLHWLHARYPGSGLLVAPPMLQRCVDVIDTVTPRALPLLLDLIAQLFRVAPLYKQTFLDMALTSALVHCLTPHSRTHLVPVLRFLWDLARNDASVALDLVDDATLLRQIFALLQLPIVHNSTFQCLALKRPSDAQLDVIIAATQVLCVVTSATRAALIVLHALELQWTKVAPSPSAEGMCPRSTPNTRPLLRTVLDLLAVSPSAELKQSLLALTQHLARAMPSVTVARLCDHGGILVLFDCLFETTGAVQVMVLKLLQLLMDVSGPRGADPSARHASISPRMSVLQSIGHSTTNATRFSMAVAVSSEVKRRTALRPAETGRRSLLTESSGPLESVALISARIAFFGALYPIYDHRLDEMTLGNQTTEVDLVWIEDMLRRLVVFGQLSFAELHLVSRCMVIHRVLPSRSVITEPGVYVITTGKVSWHLDASPLMPHILERGCMVGVSSCVGGAPERAIAMSGVVSLVLLKATIESALPRPIQQKLLGGMDRIRGMYATDRRPDHGTYLARFKVSLMAPPLVGASSILLATMLHAVAATKEASRINPWLLVHLIDDIAQWHGPVPPDLVSAVVVAAAAVLSSQAHHDTHRILLTLGRRHGAAGATFFASAFLKPIDDLVAPTDVPLCNALGQVLLALASYHCETTAECSLSSHLCRCTLRARSTILQSLNVRWLDAVMTLFEEQPLLPRLDYRVLYRVLRKLFGANNFQLASYLTSLTPRRLVHSFVGDVLNLAEDDAIEAQKLLLTLARHPDLRNLIVCHSDVVDVDSEWSRQQRAAIRSGSLHALELLSCLCCATTPDAVPHLVGPIYRALVSDSAALDVLAVNAADGTMKRSLAAVQSLRNLCVATMRLEASPSPAWDHSLRTHATLLPSLLHALRVVPSNPFPFNHSSRLLVLAEVLLYSCRRGLHLALDSFDLAHSCVAQLQSLLDVPILGCVLENARTRLARVLGNILIAPPPSLQMAQCHSLAYMLLETTSAAFSQRHEGLLRVLVRLLACLPSCAWFRSLQIPPGTVDIAVAAVGLVMEITLMPWDSIKHVSALCVAALCDLPRVADVLTQDVYVAKICATLRSGCVGMQGFVSVLARLCETPTMRLRLLSYPACVASVEHILPLLHEHACSVDAAYVLWTLWRTQRKTFHERLVISPSTTDALLMLLQPSVPWLETSADKRCHVAAGAFLELWRGADVPATTWVGVVQQTSAHVSRWSSEDAPPHQMLKVLSALLTGHAGAMLIVHVQRKRHLPWGTLWTAAGAKDSYYLHLAAFTTAFLRLEASAPVRTHVQTLLGETPQLWSTTAPSMLHGTSNASLLCILRLLYRACLGHRDNTIRVVAFWDRCRSLVTDACTVVEIPDLVCRLWQLGFRACPSAAQDKAVLLSFALYRQLHSVSIDSIDSRRVATRVCRTYTRLLRLAPRLQPPPDVQTLLSPLLERHASAMTLAAVALGVECARRLGTPTPKPIVDHVILLLCHRVPHPVYWDAFVLAAQAATHRLDATEEDNTWVTLLEHGRVLSHASTDVDVVFRYLDVSTAPDKLLEAAERVVATATDPSERSWWLHVLRCCAMMNPSGTEHVTSFVLGVVDVVTAAVQRDALPCVRDAAAALLSELLRHRQPALTAYTSSLLPSLLATVTLSLAHCTENVTAMVRLVSQLLDATNEARTMLAPHLPRLLPVLCDRLLHALRHNHLQEATDLMQLVVGILDCHRYGYTSPADKLVLASATLQCCLELAIVKRSALVLVARCLRASWYLADVAPALYLPLSNIPLKRQPMVGQLLVQHIVTHTTSTNPRDAELFLDALAALLHPTIGVPTWLYEALVRGRGVAQKLDQLPLLHAAPASLAACLRILSHLLLAHKPTRDRAIRSRIAPFLMAPTQVVAVAALSCYWVLHRQDLSPDAKRHLLSVLATVEKPSEASYGLYAVLLTPPTVDIESLHATRGFRVHLDAMTHPVERAVVRERAKFLWRLAVVAPDFAGAHHPSTAHLVQSLSIPCSKAALYALQGLRQLTSSLNLQDVIVAIQPHLWYGLTNTEDLLSRGIDSRRKTQGTLAMLNVGHALDLAAAYLDARPICNRHKRSARGAVELFQLLLHLAHHGPWTRQALAMDLAARLFERVHCETAFIDGTHRTLDALLKCLHIPRLQAPGLHLLAVASTSPWVQAAVLASDGVLDRLLALLRHNSLMAPLVWRILTHLAASERQPLPMLSALVAAHVWIDVRSYDISTHRDVARTIASLANEPKCIPEILRLQNMLSLLHRDCDVDIALLETQLCIVAFGGANHELSALTSVVLCLDAVFLYDHGACAALDKGLTATTLALTELVATFYACAAEHDEGPCVEASGSKLRPQIYVGCNGTPLSSPSVYVQLFRLWDLACSHPHRGVASVSWSAVLRMLLHITRASTSGCFLVAEASTLRFLASHVVTSTVDQCVGVCDVLHAVVRVRAIALQFARVSSTSPSLVHLLLAAVTQSLRGPRGTDHPFVPTLPPFLTTLALLCEHPPFLHAPFSTDESPPADSVISLLLYGVYHSMRRPWAYATLAAKLFVRLCTVHSLDTLNAEMTRATSDLRGLGLTKVHIAQTLLHAVYLTNFEFEMHLRVLVRVVHSVLVRMAALGRIDKGVPGLLHDHGPTNLLLLSRAYMDECEKHGGEWATRSQWAHAMKEEHVKYCADGYEALYAALESANRDPQLIVAIESTRHATMCLQTLHYVLQLLHEACVASSPSAASDVHLFFQRIEHIGEWIILCLESPEMDVGYYTNQIEALCRSVRHLLSSHKSHDFGPSMTPATDPKYPVCIELRHVHLHSWVWALLGSRPYVRLGVGRKHAYYSCHIGRPTSCSQHHHRCGNYDVTDGRLVVDANDALQSLDIQLWMYLPWSPVDVCIGRATAGFPMPSTASIEFYPEQRDKMRFDVVQPYGSMTVVATPATAHGAPSSSEFPYSTCGSKALRRRLARSFLWLAQSLRSLVRRWLWLWPTPMQGRVVAVGSAKHRGTADMSDAAAQLVLHWNDLQLILERMTSKEKLIGSYEKQFAIDECKHVAELLLGSGAGSFDALQPHLLSSLTDPAHHAIWHRTSYAIRRAVELHMPLGLTFLKTHLHAHVSATSGARQVPLLEVCNGIPGLDDVAPRPVAPTMPTTVMRTAGRFLLHGLLGVAPKTESGASIRRRHLPGRDRILPIQSIFAQPEAPAHATPGYEHQRAVAPATLNHFLLQPIERLQALLVVSKIADACFGHARLARVSIPEPAAVSRDLRQSTARLATILHRAWRQSLASAPAPGSSPSLSLVPPAATPHARSSTSTLLKHMATLKRGQILAPSGTTLHEIEAKRKLTLALYRDIDPFDAHSKLKALNARARKMAWFLYRGGWVADVVHWLAWTILTITVWRLVATRHAIREASRTYRGLLAQSSGLLQRRGAVGKTHRRKRTVDAVDVTSLSDDDPSDLAVLRSEKELRYFLVVSELQGLFLDLLFIWPTENGKIGLGNFWSSLTYTAMALGLPLLFYYVLTPWVRDASLLSLLACWLGVGWVLLTLLSIVSVTTTIQGFNDTRRVDAINLTDFPACLKNYLAIVNILWELVQLNTIPWQVWDASYVVHQIAALVTIDINLSGYFVAQFEFNAFLIKQRFAVACLVLWFFSLKAANKFKGMNWLNYVVTFLLPSALSSVLFMFLVEQYIYAMACYKLSTPDTTKYVLWSNPAIVCWTPTHWQYAMVGMCGMGLFIPLAVLSHGSHQLAFPQLDLDIQTSPLFAMIGQLVKGLMIGAKTFFATNVRFYLGVSILGDVVLLVSHYRFRRACSTWHVRAAKLVVYTVSLWSAVCAMLSTYVDRDTVPLFIMYAGHAAILVLLLCVVRYRVHWLYDTPVSGKLKTRAG